MSAPLDPGTAATVLVVFLVAATAIWLAIGGVFFAYWRVRSAHVLASQVLFHYVKAEYLHLDEGIVTIQAQRRRHVFRLLSLRRVTMAYFYVGRNGRGGRLNHPKPKTEYARVAIAGSDFIANAADNPIYMRWWDRAIALPCSYTGPAKVTLGVNPRADRRIRCDASDATTAPSGLLRLQ